jgi:transposase-like protein
MYTGGIMLSDKDSLKGRAIKKRRKPDEAQRWWSDAQKLEAVKLWLVSGSLTAVAAALNIPYQTLMKWRVSTWWNDLVTEIKTEGTIKLSNKLQNIATKAMDVTLDRLENGDWVLNQKTGELIRRPVSLRDAHQVGVGMIDRHLALEKKPVEDESKQATADKLTLLAEAFSQFAKKTRKVEVIDAQNIGKTYPAIEGQGRERTEEVSLRLVEQNGPHERRGIDGEGEKAELHVSGGTGERSASEVSREQAL